MEPEAPDDALARLAPAAHAPVRARLRLGVGAAIVLLITAVVISVVVSLIGQQTGSARISPVDAAETASSHAPGEAASTAAGAIIFVHILGAVHHPGLFELHEGSRVIDAVAAAGGLAEAADPAGVNLARPVSDGEQLYIPRLGEIQPGVPSVGAGQNGPGPGGATSAKVNINTATAAELENLPRIGPAMAERIIDYREANGRFATVDDLRQVTGIGEKTFDALKELVTP